ncbi:antibiotic biosynthesis monooxygenase [Chromobacterium violaceum]|uniref:antibiotic biosynthesis monooxygenase family protein n=1 Tax=Chromobacterium violaceum TaxID=536 RepID=UPI000C126DF2|nr:antibiotic biosynthesis monooxygenase [Chromobacterium violaceum]ATP27302.1 antibiotic biosynthesis monooxygenase [Chromobacterium violaceum]ATP31217.1 antibiotic biosynthesis monooxygenase [Chromobacterium violaceum]
MIAVIFEVTLADGGRDGYLQWAARLAEQLGSMDGFVSIERFQSLNRPDRLLSLSFWRDEAALAAWRKLESHRMAQAAGRGGLFADYRLRVAAVLRDYGLDEREQAPPDSRAAHSA